jgi:hypothetical protein
MRNDDTYNLNAHRIPFHDAAGEDILKVVESYWKGLGRKGQIPLRTDLAAAELDDALPYCFIAQRSAPGMARMRVAGQALRDLLKMDARGLPLSAFLSVETREALMPLVESAFCDPAIVEIALESTAAIGRPPMKARMILLPLRDEENQTTRLFGALVTSGTTGLRPRQFTLSQRPIIQQRKVGNADFQLRVVSETENKPIMQTRKIAAATPALRLVVDNT